MDEVFFDEREISEMIDRMERLEGASLPVPDAARPPTLYALCRARSY